MVAHDISESVRNTQKLHDTEERFRSAFENAPFGLCITSPEGWLLQANKGFCETFGYSEQELLGTHFARIPLVCDSAGEPLYFVVHIEDITKRKRAEDALRESEERFRTMANDCPMAIWISDTDGRIRFSNGAYARYYGSRHEEDDGKAWRAAIHPDDLPTFWPQVQRAIQDHSRLSAEVRLRRADGEWRWIASYAEPRFSTL